MKSGTLTQSSTLGAAAYCLIFFLQITIILLADIIVRNPQYQFGATRALDGQHAIIVIGT